MTYKGLGCSFRGCLEANVVLKNRNIESLIDSTRRFSLLHFRLIIEKGEKEPNSQLNP